MAMILLMVLAQLYGVVQMALLGWAARTIRLRVLLLAMLGGVYAAAPVAALLEVGWTRMVAAVSGDPLFEVTSRASYTVAPFIEECVKLVPLLLLWLVVRSVRRQWGVTDFVLAGAALGAGFGLAEDLLRYADDAGRAVHLASGGWVIPAGLSAPTVPGVREALTSWLPAGVGSGGPLGDGPADAINVHLVWSCVAGLGLALALRGGWRRAWLVGLGLVALAGADHAAFNTQGIAGGLARALAAPFGAARVLIWAYPLAVLATAIWLDRRALCTPSPLPSTNPASAAAEAAARASAASASAAGGPASGPTAGAPAASARAASAPGGASAAGASAAGAGIVLACERRAPVRAVGLAWLGVAHPPWSLWAVWGFVRLRRGYLLSGRGGEPDVALGQAIGLIAPALDRAGGQAGSRVWREAVRRLSSRGAAADGRWPAMGELLTTRRGLLALAWLLLLLPPALYLLVGGVPSLASVQRAMATRYLFWLVIAAAVAGAAWTAWSLAAGARHLPKARRHPAADVPTTAILRLLVRGGSLLVSLFAFWLLLRGHAPTDHLLAGAHILDAVGRALLIVGLLLALAAVAADPPFAFALLAGGGGELLWTGVSEALVGRLVVSGVVGGVGVALMDAGDGAGNSGSGEDGAERGGSGGDRGGSTTGGQEPVSGHELVPGLPYTADELAQLAGRHAGAGELEGRPTLEQIHRTLTAVEGRPIPGQNAVRFDDEGVRVIINRDLPWRSTAYFPGH
jgi:RsiW-degrading membrane proteinase PrsW (M82 family)